ncbi:hypothetical protein [Halalkalibacter lacteus]|uniref:hypothetical protein n=1 Tax=Halalkalibacter lacteus TaxID=3090663 RepID=UPI002FC83B34
MDNIREFKVKNHYLVEIDNQGDLDYRQKVKTWSWDIYIAANDHQEYRGKALAPGKGIEIPWTELSKADLLEEMIEICERQMPKDPYQ